ncbi:regulatory helix-turn-helix protein [Azoarcus sp. CIB]|uniref:LysR family transcriptional regulator n=1 Tax=Aromatoleum sp. (strain CIB) TaxID=198107 RepID=UPI00067DCA1E|nr:LysR family transcriptional regulator [Azoarcus sp. CIB]AKU10936.1 regulatory helix-turn-helix protein [Azoarcus sp. CIB]
MDSLPDWNDLRIFLAVARLGTISLAGERLGIEHSTVSRRIDRLEANLSVVLFDRRRTGYLLTDAGHALIPHAERMESALLEAIEESAGLGVRVKGSVRVGTPEGVGIHLIAPGLAKLQREHPELHVQLMPQPQYPSLVTREVEILITLDPPEVGRYKVARLTDVDFSIYCSPGYRDAHPPIRQLSDIAEHDFVDYIHDGSLSGLFRVLDELTPHPRRIFTSTSILAQREAAAAGMGLVALSPFVADLSDDLVCVFPGQSLVTRTLWIAAPEDLLRIKRVRVVWDFIRDLIEQRPEDFLRNV